MPNMQSWHQGCGWHLWGGEFDDLLNVDVRVDDNSVPGR